jgi:hypothetical protein
MRIQWQCSFCCRAEDHDEDVLPVGWRWFHMVDNLEGVCDPMDRTLICAGCVQGIRDVLDDRHRIRADSKSALL